MEKNFGKIEKKIRLYNCIHKISILIGVLTVILPLVFWKQIPDRIPIHYNAAGVVDNWTDKTSMILIMFCVAILTGLMCIAVYVVKTNLLSRYTKEVEKTELTRAYPMVVCMNLVMQCMFAYIMFCVTTRRSLGKFFVPIVLIAIFAPLVVFLFKRTKQKAGNSQEIEDGEEGKVYRSVVDWWLGLMLGGTIVWMFYLTILPIVRTGKVEWMITICTIVTCGILIPLFRIRYVLYSEHILISCSIYGKVRICYKDIVSIKATRNPISSAALSLKRLQIDYVEDGVHRTVLISPVRKKEFLEYLEQRRQREV